MQTFDAQTIDSTGVFFANELTRIDPILVEPMVDFPYARDVDIIPLDVGDETTAYDAIKYTATGGVNPAGKSFVSPKSTEIGVVGQDMERVQSPTFVWAEAIQYSVIELERAVKLGRSLPSTMLDGLNLKWNLDNQNQIMTGDTAYGVTGLVNSSAVTAATVANGASASPLWTSKTDDEILTDINTVLSAAWAASGYTSVPRRLALPPAKFGYLVTRKIVNGSMSLAKYIAENSLSSVQGGGSLELVPMRELAGAGAGATDRMLAYTKRRDVVRFARAALRSLPVQYAGLFQKTIYYSRVGTLEIPKPQMLRYADGF
jgi:hypothetical protein